MTISPGTKLGPYEILSVVGKGGMGEVFRARDTRLNRDVAVKVLPESFARDPDRLGRFEQEARSVAALNHPNLLTVFDVGTMPAPDGGTIPYLVSELLEGSTLRELLDKGALPLRKVLDYSAQVARGLAAAHDHGVVHRDIKPDNLFLTRDGRVKILDFGLAKLKPQEALGDETVAHNLTHVDAVLGTVGYMSPEQLRGRPVDARSDLFSLGAVMYEMLSGRRAFQGDSSADVMSAILNKEPPDLPENTAEFSPALDHIVRRCLEKDPQQRFQSAGDLAFALQEASSARNSGSLSGVSPRPALAQQRARWMFPAAGLAILLAAICATWFAARAGTGSAPPVYTQVTFQQGFVPSARFLHDGHTVLSASRWGSETATTLHTSTADSGGVTALNIPANQVLSVSVNDDVLVLHDVRSVGPGYVAVGTLSEMHFGGGAPKPLMEDVQYADWNPEGSKFAIVRFIADKHVYRLEYPVGTVLYETPGWMSDPRFSRDGKMIAFVDHPLFGDDMGGPAVMDLQGHVRKLGSITFSSAQHVAWSPNNKEIWFSGTDKGVDRSLWAVTLDGKVRQLLTAPGTLDIQDVLPDGRTLINHMSERRVQMVSTPQFPEPRDFSWMDWAYSQRFSSDGQSLVFGDQHSGGKYGVFIRNLDGSPAVRVGDGDLMDISPDGKFIVSRLPDEKSTLELSPTGIGEPRTLTDQLSVTSARWINNNLLMVNGNLPGKPARSFTLDLQGNLKPLTPEGVRTYAVSADGKQLLEGDRLFRAQKITAGPGAGNVPGATLAPLAGGQGVPLNIFKVGDFPLDFNADGTQIYVERQIDETHLEQWQIDIATGKRTLLHTIASPGIPALSRGMLSAISRDGKSYSFQYHPAISTIYEVQGLK